MIWLGQYHSPSPSWQEQERNSLTEFRQQNWVIENDLMFRLNYFMLVALVVVCLQTAKQLIIQSIWAGPTSVSGLLLSPRLRNPLINLAIFVIWFWISSHRVCQEHCAFGLESPSEDYENALSSTLTTHVARFSAVGVNQWSLINLCDTPD